MIKQIHKRCQNSWLRWAVCFFSWEPSASKLFKPLHNGAAIFSLFPKKDWPRQSTSDRPQPWSDAASFLRGHFDRHSSPTMDRTISSKCKMIPQTFVCSRIPRSILASPTLKWPIHFSWPPVVSKGKKFFFRWVKSSLRKYKSAARCWSMKRDLQKSRISTSSSAECGAKLTRPISSRHLPSTWAYLRHMRQYVSLRSTLQSVSS